MVSINTVENPFDRVKTYSIGFDRMFNTLFDESFVPTTNYPPYNIVKTSDEKYVIEIAIAGFSKNDIEIETKENTLTVNSKSRPDGDDDKEYIHRGVSARSFKKAFSLAEDVFVQGATFENGMLCIELERIVPEEKKPKTIKIK